MSKTITLRLDEETYLMLKRAAKGTRRTISNYIEFAAVNYLSYQSLADEEEAREILEDKALMKALKKSENEIQSGDYEIV